MDLAFPHVAERLFGRAHPIEPASFRAIVESPLGQRVLTGLPIDAGKRKNKSEKVRTARDIRREQMAAVYDGQWVRGAGDGAEYFLTGDGVAIVPVVGILSARFDWLAALCGWTTYEGLSCTFDAMGEDYRVKAVLLDVESPGGEAAGMLDIADKIIAARAVKPVWAVANAYAFSAAYAVAGSATRLVVPRLCQVGSIGAVAIHLDQSAADAQLGLKYTAIYSGARKIDGWPHAPLSDEARASMQTRIDYCRDQFAALVGRQGRISEAQALSTEAEIYHDQPAVDAGLADAVGSFEAALQELSDHAANRPRSVTTAAAPNAVETERSQPMADATKPGQEQAADTITKPATTAATDTPANPAATAAAATPPQQPAASAKAHKCGKCGHSWDDEDDDKDKATVEAATQAAAADAVLELCASQGVSAEKARGFIKAMPSLADVRSAIAADKARGTDATSIDASKPAATAPEASMWAKVIAKLPGSRPAA